MPQPDLVRVRHALQAAEEAIEFLGDASADELAAEKEKAYAIVFALATLGEALNAVSRDWREDHPEIPWRDAIGLRHRLIHGYHDIRWDRVWATVRDDLPGLVAGLRAALSQQS